MSEQSDSDRITKFWKRVSRSATRVECPACHNDKDKKKTCLVCRKSGFVWK